MRGIPRDCAHSRLGQVIGRSEAYGLPVYAVATVLRAADLTVTDLDELLGETSSTDLLVVACPESAEGGAARRQLVDEPDTPGSSSFASRDESAWLAMGDV